MMESKEKRETDTQNDDLPEFSLENVSLLPSSSRTEETMKKKQEKKAKHQCKCSGGNKGDPKEEEKEGERQKETNQGCLRCHNGKQQVKDQKIGGFICK